MSRVFVGWTEQGEKVHVLDGKAGVPLCGVSSVDSWDFVGGLDEVEGGWCMGLCMDCRVLFDNRDTGVDECKDCGGRLISDSEEGLCYACGLRESA